MFWFLHRACLVVFWCFWLAAAVFIYERRAALQPAFDCVELVWQHDFRAAGNLPQLDGKVTEIFAGDSFQFEDKNGYAFNYGLAGVVAPRANPGAPAELKRSAGASRANLSRLLAGRPVTVSVTLANPQTRTGLGLAHCDDTNVNVAVLAAGQGRLNLEQIRTLPLRDEFEMLRAERFAQRQRLGIWGETPLANEAATPK
jgi:endonuclease YncB( thermonuclease family)